MKEYFKIEITSVTEHDDMVEYEYSVEALLAGQKVRRVSEPSIPVTYQASGKHIIPKRTLELHGSGHAEQLVRTTATAEHVRLFCEKTGFNANYVRSVAIGTEENGHFDRDEHLNHQIEKIKNLPSALAGIEAGRRRSEAQLKRLGER